MTTVPEETRKQVKANYEQVKSNVIALERLLKMQAMVDEMTETLKSTCKYYPNAIH